MLYFCARLLDGQRVLDGGGEGLLDHDGDVKRRGLLDGGSMPGDGGVDEDRLRMGASPASPIRSEKKRLSAKVELSGVLLAQGGVGLGDADQLDLGVRRQVMQEAPDVIVIQADDGDADVSGSLR